MSQSDAEQLQPLKLCKRHKQEWKQSEYAEHNCDYCKLAAQSESGANWESAAKAMTKHAEALQAKIDRLMLEHCPEEMTPEQIANWERHQRAATPEEEEAALQRALTAPSPSGVEEGGHCVGLDRTTKP